MSLIFVYPSDPNPDICGLPNYCHRLEEDEELKMQEKRPLENSSELNVDSSIRLTSLQLDRPSQNGKQSAGSMSIASKSSEQSFSTSMVMSQPPLIPPSPSLSYSTVFIVYPGACSRRSRMINRITNISPVVTQEFVLSTLSTGARCLFTALLDAAYSIAGSLHCPPLLVQQGFLASKKNQPTAASVCDSLQRRNRLYLHSTITNLLSRQNLWKEEEGEKVAFIQDIGRSGSREGYNRHLFLILPFHRFSRLPFVVGKPE
ncbi:hypothetical protein C8J56DRAFT_1066015 [Mycena floridula]|nr:hypothetical protein C8J56DRAFT_1066015 [Mycena floridula]